MTNATLTLPKGVTRLDHDWHIEEAEAREAGLIGAPNMALFWGSASRAVDGDLWQFNQGELQAAAPHAQGFLVYDGGKVAYLPAMAYRWACAQTRATPVVAPESDAAEPDAAEPDAAEPDAAPDLLEALRMLVQDCNDYRMSGPEWGNLRASLSYARAAIAKAEGR